jgi:rieske iron-sulfur protein
MIESMKPVAAKRRQLLCGMCALGLGAPALGQTPASNDPAASSPPQVGDFLTNAFGDKAGQPITVDELAVDQKQIFAFAQDPVSGLVRNGSRMHQLVLIRLDPATLTPGTLARSTNGVVAYSGMCSHTGCDVTDWNADIMRFQCPCHESQFDPRDGARVVGGPAPWQLAALPLKEVDGKLAVAAPFEGRLGFQQPGLSPFGI